MNKLNYSYFLSYAYIITIKLRKKLKKGYWKRLINSYSENFEIIDINYYDKTVVKKYKNKWLSFLTSLLLTIVGH